jgi:hypothetical protein
MYPEGSRQDKTNKDKLARSCEKNKEKRKREFRSAACEA